MPDNVIKGQEAIQNLTVLYGRLATEIDKATEETKEFIKSTQKTPSEYTKNLEALKNNQEAYAKALAAVKGEQEKFTADQKESARLAKARLAAESKLRQATSEQGKALQKVRVELQQVNKREKENAELSSKLTSLYRKKSIELNRLRLRYKDVALAQGESSTQAKLLAKQVNNLDKKLKRVDANAGQFGRTVGNYPKLLGGAVSSLRSFAAAFGLTSAIFILAQTTRNAIGIFKEFDQSQADLAAILGRNTEEISALTSQAKELGATTAFTATQVAQLQLELAKLGFSDDQILAATLGIENLAIATGVDAARAAKLGGSALRGFGLAAEEANRVAATLAVSTTKSASTFESLEVGLPKVSAIAKSFGFTIEDTTALLGGLSNAGFESSIAGTSLRQIFLQLADSNGKLAKRLGGGAKDFDELIEQFKKLEEEGISLGEAFNLTNARSVAAFKTFLSGADDLKVLRDSITDVETELDTLAEQKLDSVQGKVTLLNSAWEGWILSLDKTGSAADTIKNSLEFLTVNLEKILNTIIKGVKAFLTYKAIMLSVSLISRVYTASVVALRIAKIALAGGIGKATTAMKAFNLATKANPIGLLLSVLAGAVALFIAFKDGAEEAAEAQRRLNEEFDKTRQATEDSIAASIAQVDAQLKAIEDSVDDEKKANKDKIALLDEEIDKRKELAESTEESISKQRKSIGQLVAEERGQVSKNLNRKKVFAEAESLVAIQQANKEAEILKAKRRELIVALGKITRQGNREINEQAIKDLFDLERSRLKAQIKLAEENFKNEENQEDARFAFQQKAIEKRVELAELERAEAIRKAEGRTNKITQINEEFNNRLVDQDKKGSEEKIAILNSEFKKRITLLSQIQQAQNIKLAESIEEEKRILLNRGVNTAEIEKRINKIRSDARKKDLDGQIAFIEQELKLASFSAETQAEIAKRLSKLKKELLDLEFNDAKNAEQEELERLQRREQAIREAFQGIGDAIGISGDNLATIFNGIENGFESAGQAARAFGQLASEVFNSIADAQNARIEDQITALGIQRDIAITAAGDSAEAREEIERQFQERQAALRAKQAKNDKDAAIVQSVIGTATAVISALGMQPFTPANFALAATVGLLGAAQTAIIASQPIPQFAAGVRNFEGGLAWLGDGGRTEVGVTPSGNVFKTPATDTLYNLPTGTDIYKSEDDFERALQQELSFNGILPAQKASYSMPVKSNNGISNDVFKQGIRQLQKSIDGMPTSEVNFDEAGYSKFHKRKNAKTKVQNARFKGRGRKV